MRSEEFREFDSLWITITCECRLYSGTLVTGSRSRNRPYRGWTSFLFSDESGRKRSEVSERPIPTPTPVVSRLDRGKKTHKFVSGREPGDQERPVGCVGNGHVTTDDVT